ncbi:MAG: amino acid transporter [Betaproteobacteria bacterium]|nr:MAG: amino acid transporter [Betaproteobacteria bacterium]
MNDSARPAGAPQPLLGRADAIAIIVGIVIGAGIFKTPSMVAGVTGDVGWLVVAWLLGAVVSLAGALCYAELATTYPHAGGDYHFLTRAWGRHASFLYAWARATVINTGAIALLAFVFGDYMQKVAPLGVAGGAVWGAAIVIALTAINIAGLKASAGTQKLLTVVEVLGLVAIGIAGFMAPAAASAAPAFSSSPPLGLFGLAMVFVLLTYGGWNEAAYISAELRGGRRAIVSVIVWSLAIIAAVYLVVNLALLHGLGLKGLADSKAAGADVMQLVFGTAGAQALALFVAIAALTSINATMIVGARTNYAMGRDWTALRFMGGWHASRGTPVAAFVVQGAVALALVAFGALQHDGFEAMVEFTAPVFWGFLFLVGVALFILRAKDAGAERPFRVPLYPLTPIVFCAACAWLCYSSVTYAMSRNAVHVSLIVMAVGVVALLITGAKRAPPRVTAGND